MKSILLVFAGLFFLTYSSYAHGQPIFYFTPSDTLCITPEEVINLDIRALEFNDLLEVRFSVQWDPAVLSLVGMTNEHEDLDITPSAFVINNEEGYFTFAWRDYDMLECYGEPTGILDSSIVFSAIFSGIEGISEVNFSNDPVNIFMTRINVCPIDISCICGSTSIIKVNGMPTSTANHSTKKRPTIAFPNPTDGWLSLSIPEDKPLPASIRIVDSQGVVYLTIHQPSSTILDLSMLKTGLYFMEVNWPNRQNEILPLVVN